MSQCKKYLSFIIILLNIGCAHVVQTIAPGKGYFVGPFPQGWVEERKVNVENLNILEFVPKGQTINNWETLISYQSYSGSLNMALDEFMESAKAKLRDKCPSLKEWEVKRGGQNGYESIS